MRVDELHLKAYGPFAGRTLDLSGGAQGLHVIYGPNEAGKSSALRALKALLYGVDERTTDGFLHGNDSLRVGGRLRLTDGRELTFTRRKGRKQTLLAPDEEHALDESLLLPFVSSVSSNVFSSLFGIDHQALVDGGEQILQQKSDVGSTLFAAALGSRAFQALLSQLEDEAAELYRPSGSKYLINKAIADHKDARKEMREAALAVKDWEVHEHSLEQASRRLEAIQEEMGALLKEKSTVERLRRILPSVGLRRTTLAAIADMGRVVQLPSDFGERLRTALTGRDEAKERLATIREKRSALGVQAKKIPSPARLLNEEGTIRSLYQRLGAYRKAVADRPSIDGKRQQARTDARNILKSLRPDISLDDVPSLRPNIAAAKRPIQELSARHQALETAVRKASKVLAEKDQKIAVLRKGLGPAPREWKAGPIKRSVDDARRSGDLDRLLRENLHAEARQERQCLAALSALGVWRGPLEAAHALPVPSNETVDRYVESFRLAEERRRRRADQHQSAAREMTEVARTLAAMRLTGAVPTELDLVQARNRRNEGWALVKRGWLEQADIDEDARIYDDERPLPAAYEESVTVADDVADRLRREADRVAAHAQALVRQDELTAAIKTLDGEANETGDADQSLESEWIREWSACGFVPLSPLEMRAWLNRFAALKDQLLSLFDVREKTVTLRDTVAAHRASVASQVAAIDATTPEVGDSLSAVLQMADSVIERIEAAAVKQEDLRRLVEERAEAAAELVRDSDALSAWKGEWIALVQSLGHPPDSRPSQIQSMVEGYADLFAKLDEADGHRRRVYGIDQDIAKFDEEVRAFAKEVAPEETEDSDAARCVERLNDALTRATTDEARARSLEEQLQELSLNIQETERKLTNISGGIEALCREAECDQVEQLEEAQRHSKIFAELRNKVAALEDKIIDEGDGADLQALVTEAEEVSPDDLPARLERVVAHITDLEEERGRLRETKGAEESELRRMTGASTAADAASKAQEILASMRHSVESYLRTRTAALLLRREIDRYREANQDPVVVRGGALFSSITCGSFAGIDTEITDDEAQLVGVRPGGGRVHVGGMSSGARDQLYLALRLATLERYLATAESMPFVVDDILINFDDARALATLTTLAEFSAKTQVLLFTHHLRIREMATRVKSACGVFVQELP
jgi:uncharacterized protein YhaN